MIKNFKIFENSLYSAFKKAEKNGKEDDVAFKDIIGIDIEKYKYKVEQKHYGDLSLFFKEKDLNELLDIESGVLNFALQFTGYNNYEYDVDDSEVGYIVSDENEQLVKKLFNLLDIKIETDSENISDVFQALGDNIIDIGNITYEISCEYENAVKKNCLDALKNLPFDLSNEYDRNYDFELVFNFDDVEEYIKKHKLKDINTIGDLIKKTDFSDFDYSRLDNPWETDYKYDYKDVDKAFQKEVKQLIDKLEEGMKEPDYYDPNQLNLFQDIDDEIIKKILKHQPKKYNFQYIFKKLDIRNLHYAQRVGGKILGWFKSYEFQKEFMKDEKLENYNQLKKEKIIHPAIEYEYGHLPIAAAYNL